MNILLFVMTMLMLFSLLTYAKIESYKGFAGMRAEFVRYMSQSERSLMNEREQRRYTKVNGSVRGKHNLSSNQAKEASKRLNILPLMKFKGEQQAQYGQTYTLLRKLIYNLYAAKPFFQEMEKTRPGFVDEILQKITAISQEMEEGQLKRAGDLSNFNFNDDQLNEMSYKIFKGVALPKQKKKTALEIISAPEEVEAGDAGEDDDEAQEYHSVEGYVSLLDFLIVDKKKQKIRVYLASRPLLMAIFDDPNTVSEIMQTRKNLYRDLKSTRGADAKQASETFRNTFLGRKNAAIDESMLDFTVNTTSPD